MIEYKLRHMDNSPVTLDDLNEINPSIGCMFPEGDKDKIGSKIGITYGVNGHTFRVYYGYNSSTIGLPIKYQKDIKKTMKNIVQLKLGKN